MARESEPFEVSPTQPLATLLAVGDSTGVGTGASSPAQSLAGLIAKDHPRVRIVNRAKDGAKFAGIASQLEALGDQRIDAVLVLGGGNDVIRFTGADALAQAVIRTAQLARARQPGGHHAVGERWQCAVLFSALVLGDGKAFARVACVGAQSRRGHRRAVRQPVQGKGRRPVCPAGR